jgi:hypothetical protein
LQGDRRRKAFDTIDFGDTHLVEEPAGVRSNRFQVAALRLGKESAECKGRLSRSGNAGKNYECVTRDVDIYVPQIVLSSATYGNEARCFHGKRVERRRMPSLGFYDSSPVLSVMFPRNPTARELPN